MAASEQSSSLNVALADGQLSGNRDGRFGSFAAVHVTQLGVHLFLDYCPRALERATK